MALDYIGSLGKGLVRPESVLPLSGRSILASNARGGVSVIAANGATQSLTPHPDPTYENAEDGPLRFVTGDTVNGLSVMPDGRILIANIGKQRIETIAGDGQRTTLYDAIDGDAMGLVNYAAIAPDGALWVSVSADRDLRPQSGYLAYARPGEPLAIAATGLNSPNEFRFTDEGRSIILAETGGRRLVRFKVGKDNSLSGPETYGPNDLGGFPDGIALDASGRIWGVLIGLDQIYSIDEDGEKQVHFTGGDADWFAANSERIAAGEIPLSTMIPQGFPDAPLFSSLAFGGDDLRTLYVGSLCGRRLACFRTPQEGPTPPYWGLSLTDDLLAGTN